MELHLRYTLLYMRIAYLNTLQVILAVYFSFPFSIFLLQLIV